MLAPHETTEAIAAANVRSARAELDRLRAAGVSGPIVTEAARRVELTESFARRCRSIDC
jgi:hypothetical protein